MSRWQPRGGRSSWTLSILLHLGVIGALTGLWYWAAHRPRPPQPMGIEGRVVAPSQVQDTVIPEPVPVPDPEVAPVQEQSPAPEPEPEPAADEEAVKAAEAAELAHVAEERRVAEERLVAERKADEEAARVKAAREKAERDRKAKEQAERDKAEKEKAEKEKAERERLAREKAEKDRAEQARNRREEELSAQLAAEARAAAARNSGLMAQYIGQIASKIERNWIRPPRAIEGINCEVHVTQVPRGAVTAVRVGRCNGDEALKQSIEAAVYRASPLPEPPDPALFERDLVVTFRPD